MCLKILTSCQRLCYNRTYNVACSPNWNVAYFMLPSVLYVWRWHPSCVATRMGCWTYPVKVVVYPPPAWSQGWWILLPLMQVILLTAMIFMHCAKLGMQVKGSSSKCEIQRWRASSHLNTKAAKLKERRNPLILKHCFRWPCLVLVFNMTLPRTRLPRDPA